MTTLNAVNATAFKLWSDYADRLQRDAEVVRLCNYLLDAYPQLGGLVVEFEREGHSVSVGLLDHDGTPVAGFGW